MSVVTNIVVMCQLYEAPAALGTLQELGFEQVDHQAGGTKQMEVEVWAGAWNHLDLRMAQDKISNAPWNDREGLIVLIQEQLDENPKVWRLPDKVAGV